MSCNFVSGSAFNGNTLNNYYLLSRLKNREKTNYVSLTDWCKNNFITKDVGRSLIKKKLLIAQGLYGQWWVCANLECMEELLDYLGIDSLYFDAANNFD